jgi:hypothetical protein
MTIGIFNKGAIAPRVAVFKGAATILISISTTQGKVASFVVFT